ncbi:hypothetical protein C1631_020995 [Chryseobacterium phosphatilyticum]|uniref:Uncharacterized protein n=1 Tax=Chryseobacterium phosphatilyticum TaxID=475075 RepID=A0A316WUJ4_9FLAO|nr:hypothetical protein C1631_020995 [Chryseobacterium phosphatilyticum]
MYNSFFFIIWVIFVEIILNKYIFFLKYLVFYKSTNILTNVYVLSIMLKIWLLFKNHIWVICERC